MNIEEELKKLREEIDYIENKYCFTKNYKLITTIFDKLGIKEIELSEQEISENNAVYILNRKENSVVVKKVGEE